MRVLLATDDAAPSRLGEAWVARARWADLIVGGSRERSAPAATFLGSVSRELAARAATRPLLITRRPHAAEGPLPEHVLVPAPGGREARAVLAWLDAAGRLAGCRLTLLGLLGETVQRDRRDRFPEDVARLVTGSVLLLRAS